MRTFLITFGASSIVINLALGLYFQHLGKNFFPQAFLVGVGIAALVIGLFCPKE